jgi:sarcosine oxidase, subunit delta
VLRMKLMNCPINGLRPISEFFYWGEVRPVPDPDSATDEEWNDYIFNRNGAPGLKKEWWCHMPSGVWFIAERDTERDEVRRTYLYGTEGSV